VEGLQAAGGVADAEFHARVVEGAGGREGCARRVRRRRVEFGDDDAREARVLEELAGAGAVAAAEDDGRRGAGG
jgi:hypothetical protein